MNPGLGQLLAAGTWVAALILAGVAANIWFVLKNRNSRRMVVEKEKIRSDGSLNQRRIK
ncbi:hypothetical protein JXM67_05560 [candidate division WOR-3 bacterium]|nr:hypothetical protein [candidate division WOR-3 bacterium]